LKSVKSPVQPVESISSGNLLKADYMDLAKRVNAYTDTYGILPNYANTPLGNIGYENLIYSFSKILNFQKVNNYLPSYVTVKPYTSFATSVVTQARTVYLTTDYINGYTTDMNRLNTIANALRAMGLNVINYGVGSNTHYSVLQAASIPATALVVDMYGGADAALIYEMGSSYYKKLVSTKKVFCVWMPPAWDITGLAWLPRAHDDNYSPASFTGLANPDQYLLNNGYHYIYSADLNAIISAIYKEATT
ncbi:MAG: pseudomurein-binding repeat-containing protein, partial [Methanobacterium sp.]